MNMVHFLDLQNEFKWTVALILKKVMNIVFICHLDIRAFLGQGMLAVSTANFIIYFKDHIESTMFHSDNFL
jgi:hypothetical protein